MLLKSEKGGRDFYKILRNSNGKNEKPLYSYWEQVFETEINADMWKNIYKTCFKTVKDNDIIWLQYRVLHRILGTKDYLFKTNLTTDRNCSFCEHKSETVYHLFTGCEQVQLFWTNLKSFLHSKLRLQISIEGPNIIFGCLSNFWSSISINTIYLVAKSFIFQTSRSNKGLNLDYFLSYLHRVYLEQEYIAKLESNHEKFLKLWGDFYTVFAIQDL